MELIIIIVLVLVVIYLMIKKIRKASKGDSCCK